MVYTPLQALLARSLASCLLCQAGGHELCPACSADLPWNLHACRHCAQPLSPGQDCCGACLASPPPYTAFSLFRYDFPVDRLLARLKYHGRLSPARVLGQFLAEAVTALPGPPPELLLPVPLHPARLGERGYNQASEIARPLARALGLPLELALLSRHKATQMQKGLDALARARNLRAAFRLDRARYQALGQPRRVAIIDDVLTTGATAGQLARQLRRAGAEEVLVWTLARTP